MHVSFGESDVCTYYTIRHVYSRIGIKLSDKSCAYVVYRYENEFKLNGMGGGGDRGTERTFKKWYL